MTLNRHRRTAPPLSSYLVFPVGALRLALPLPQVYRTLTVPHPSLQYQGQPIPSVSLPDLLQVRPDTAPQAVLVVAHGHKWWVALYSYGRPVLEKRDPAQFVDLPVPYRQRWPGGFVAAMTLPQPDAPSLFLLDSTRLPFPPTQAEQDSARVSPPNLSSLPFGEASEDITLQSFEER